MRFARSMFTAAAAFAAALVFAAPAAAVETTEINLNPSHVGKKAGFQEECTGPFASLVGEDGWHFVLPAASGDDFVKLSLTFDDENADNVNVVITSTDETVPSSGPGWSGYIDNAGASDKHVYVFTDKGWTLTSGTADVTGGGQDGFFNLSHTCVGRDKESPSPSPSTSTSPSTSPSPSPSVSLSESPSVTPSPSEPTLPLTGTAVGGFVIAGVGLVAAGVALMAVRRRRALGDSTEV